VLTGERLGAYAIVSRLGAGGMGEVYRARDTRLDRDVAIKVLPDALQADAEFRERFDREARAISQLSHPHICTLFDVGEDRGRAFLVMECLEGVTLGDRLEKGPLSVDEALRIGIQIADALSAAHARGIVHRDLKPGNVMLTGSASAPHAKLLDFGLAKTASSSAPIVGMSMLPTTPPMPGPAGRLLTAHGTILGTFQYMAPEQVEGLNADTRTDIFAFGAVLYEMLTGRKAFEGATQASLIAAILERQPAPTSQVQPLTPASLDHVIALCLAKHPDERWQSIRDVREELRWIASAPSAPESRTTAAPSRTRERLAWAAAVFIAGVAVAGAMAMLRTEPSKTVARLSVPLTSSTPLNLDVAQGIAISPDGTRIVYRAGDTNRTSQLYVKSIDGDTPLALRGTERPESPFFSPDGQWLAFFSAGRLRKVPIGGGPPVTICEVVSTGRGGAWAPDGTIVFATADPNFGGLLRVPADGGTPEPFANVGQHGRYSWPSLLPDGKSVLFSAVAKNSVQWDDAAVIVKRLDTGDERIVFTGGSRPRYLPSGHLVVARGSTLLAMPFDLGKLQPIGPAVVALEGVLANSLSGGVSQHDVSQTGTVVYATGAVGEAQRELAWVDRRGVATLIEGITRPVTEAVLSPDGRLLALSMEGQDRNIWTFDLARRTLSRLTFGSGFDQYPRWTPDGERIAYSSIRDGPYQVYWKAANGSGADELLIKAAVPGNFPRSWSPDGRLLLFQRGTSADSNDLWVAAADGSDAHPYVATPANEGLAQFAPDGRWVAYQSNESGRSEIFVQAFPGPGGKWQISSGGGTAMRWRRDGRELFYRNGDALMAVPVTTGSSFSAGTPQMLFRGPYETLFDVSLDGERFLMIKSAPDANPSQLNVVLNWDQELRQRVPTR
jgi:eukaryotic-like serine/threonine-protein kinase